jgi:hypothetical protein
MHDVDLDPLPGADEISDDVMDAVNTMHFLLKSMMQSPC